MRIAVTGSTGLVGARLVRELASTHEVLPVSRHTRPALDLTDRSATLAFLKHAQPEVIVHCAAMPDVDACEREPAAAWAINVEAVATLAQWTRDAQAHLVHVSTDYVFDGATGRYAIDAVPNPTGAYAMSKHAAELAVRTLVPAGHWAIARTAVVMGWPAQHKGNFGTWLIDGLRAGKPLNVFSDQTITPTHATNAAQMIAELATTRATGIWHASGAEVTDRFSFAQRLARRFGLDAALLQPVLMRDVALAKTRPMHAGLNVDRTVEALKAKPWSLDQSLEQLFAEFKEHS
ncbi:MAG: SDR family oxidoreductase [Archangium sp.]